MAWYHATIGRVNKLRGAVQVAESLLGPGITRFRACRPWTPDNTINWKRNYKI